MDAKRWLRWLGAAGGAGAALLALSLLTERRRLRVVRRTYAVSGLPPDLDSLRVAHLSDLHAGPWVPTSLLAGAVAAANAERPDVVLLTGDYVDLDRTFADVCAEVLGHLRAPHGVYAVLGNHDHEAGAERMVAALQARGITVLPNRAVPLGQGPTHLWVVGLDDTVSHRGDLREALAEVAPWCSFPTPQTSSTARRTTASPSCWRATPTVGSCVCPEWPSSTPPAASARTWWAARSGWAGRGCT